MKYYLLNKKEVKEDIWTHPIIVRTKSLSKIKKIRTLQKKLDSLLRAVKKDLFDNNAGMTDRTLELLLDGSTAEEITRSDYNSLLVMRILDTQEQKIKCCNKTEILKGKLFGNQIK